MNEFEELFPTEIPKGSVHEMLYPESSNVYHLINSEIDDAMVESLKLIRSARSFKSEFGISIKDIITGFVVAPDSKTTKFESCNSIIQRLGRLNVDFITRNDISNAEGYIPWFVDDKTEILISIQDIDRNLVVKKMEDKLKTKGQIKNLVDGLYMHSTRRDKLLRKSQIWKERQAKDRQKMKWEKRSSQFEDMAETLTFDIQKLESLIQRMKN